MNKRRFGSLAFVASASYLLSLTPTAHATLTYELRVVGQGKVAYVSYIGQVVNLELFADVTGSGPGDEGFQEGYGSILSSNGGDISGNLAASLAAPFNSNGAQNGLPQDLDGDSDFDIGSNLSDANSAFLYAHADQMRKSGGTAIANGTEFKLADLTFTVTSIADPLTASTTINFRVTNFAAVTGIEALWQQDGAPFASSFGSSAPLPSVGADVTIVAIPEPASGLLFAFGALACGVRRRRQSL